MYSSAVGGCSSGRSSRPWSSHPQSGGAPCQQGWSEPRIEDLDTDCYVCKLDLDIHRKRGCDYSVELEVLMMI